MVSGRKTACLVRFLVWFFLMTGSWTVASEIDLPAVDVRSERDATNWLQSDDPAPRFGLSSAEKGEDVFLFAGIGGPEAPVFRETKNALFSIGYGLYDMLSTKLVFANQFGNFSYLFSVGRLTSGDFDHNRRRIYNSQIGSDDADMNIQYCSGPVKWNSRVQYLRETSGLQQSPIYFDRSTRRLRVGQHGRWSLSGLSHLNADLVYDYTLHGVKNAAEGAEAAFQRGGLGVTYQALFGEMNSLVVSGQAAYRHLAIPGPDADEWSFKLNASDNFLLFSILDITAGIGVYYANSPFIYILPSLKVSWLVSDTFHWTAFGRITSRDELLPDHLSVCPWLNVPAYLAPASAELAAGTGAEALLAGRIPLIAELFWASAMRRQEYFADADGLYALRSRDVDSFGGRFEASLSRVKKLDLRARYAFRLFLKTLDHEPVHAAGLSFKWEPGRLTLALHVDYRTGNTAFEGVKQKDSLVAGTDLRFDFSKNMGFFLSLANLTGLENSLFPPYLEKGLTVLAGFRVNLL